MKLLGAAAFIVNDRGEVLLVKHNYGPLNWELPGGRAESSEPIHQTALREVREETGLEAVAESLTGIYYDPANDAHHFVYRCRLTNPEASPIAAPDETTACAYWSPEALPRPISDFTIRRIEDALRDTPNPLPIQIGPRQWLNDSPA